MVRLSDKCLSLLSFLALYYGAFEIIIFYCVYSELVLDQRTVGAMWTTTSGRTERVGVVYKDGDDITCEDSQSLQSGRNPILCL